MLTLLRGWLLSPASARKEILVDGSRLALNTGAGHPRTIGLNSIPAYIPDCRSYVVEYRPCRAGEFEAVLGEGGRIVAVSRRNPRLRFPVCWLPPAFAGRTLERRIRMIDGKPVFLRAGVGFRQAA